VGIGSAHLRRGHRAGGEGSLAIGIGQLASTADPGAQGISEERDLDAGDRHQLTG
jgi:hypothetical protein